MKKLILSGVIMIVMACLSTNAIAENVEETISAENLFTTPIAPVNEVYNTYKNRVDLGYLNVSVEGIEGATVVTLQRKFPTDTTWRRTVGTFTEDIETSLTDKEPGVLYRLGIKTGHYDVGTVTLRLGK